MGGVVWKEVGDLVQQELSFSSLCTSIRADERSFSHPLAPNRVQSTTVKANAFQQVVAWRAACDTSSVMGHRFRLTRTERSNRVRSCMYTTLYNHLMYSSSNRLKRLNCVIVSYRWYSGTPHHFDDRQMATWSTVDTRACQLHSITCKSCYGDLRQ